MNYASAWFSENVAGGFIVNFFRAILNLMVAVLYFIIDIVKWIISKI